MKEIDEFVMFIEKNWLLKRLLRKYCEKDLITPKIQSHFSGEISKEKTRDFLIGFYNENNMKNIFN